MFDSELDPSWRAKLQVEFEADYMVSLQAFLSEQLSAGKTVYPSSTEIFTAFNTTPFEQVKVVVLGQDPYHGPGQAHGLRFSVPEEVKIPPSLRNVYKEIQADLGGDTMPESGNLLSWAQQGVLLLNSVLTVEAHRAASHQGKGWERFTDKAIERLSIDRENVVFMLWGGYAQKKGQIIDQNRHLVLKAPHPSPLSAHRGFLGCRHFSQCNQYLVRHDQSPIAW